MEGHKRRIGLMGGTFDPIHHGHLIIAENMREACGLGEVWFIPAADPPHKRHERVTAAEHRFRMAVLATEGNPYFTVSRIELDRPGPSYSVDTLHALNRQHGHCTEFYFIAGADELGNLPQWHHGKELLSLCHFIVAARQGHAVNIAEVCGHFGGDGQERIHAVPAPELEISATDIRRRVRERRSIRYLVPASVEEYIYREGLYR